MQIDTLALRMRPRSPFEAADLGVRLYQSVAGQVLKCYSVVALPVFALAIASVELAPWLPALLLWWAKPWLDRTILFVLARAAFGRRTSVGDLWQAQRDVWWRQLLLTVTIRRLSPWRSYTQPVYQLERLSFLQTHRRLKQIKRRRKGSAALMTSAFSMAETALVFALVSLVYWFTPTELKPDLGEILGAQRFEPLALVLPTCYVLTIGFVEPYYVAAGFAMYLNRRTELEAWDIEQELRRAFAAR
jgi:hypothetical protein